VAALIKHATNQGSVGLTQSQVKSILKTTARSMSAGNLNSVGSGLIDAYAAVQSVSTASPDVSIRKGAILSRPFTPGDRITYTLTIANLGALPANGVRVTDTLPASLVAPISYASSLVITSAGGANYAWTVAPLAAGASGVISVYARIDPSLPITAVVVNTALVSDPRDLDLGNNSSTAYAGGFAVYLPVAMRN
jgi:uncharacterized repeat protein (TIGR01451 family)